MPATTTPTEQLKKRLANIRAEVGAARDERAVAARTLDQRRGKLATLDVQMSQLHATDEFKRADQARKALEQADKKLTDLQAAERGVLAMLGEGAARPAGQNGPQAGDLPASSTAPGAWLSGILRNQGGGMMATAQPLTTDDIGSLESLDRVFFMRLQQRSALMAGDIQIVDISTSSIKVGEVTGNMAPAVPTAETDPIPKDDIPLDDREITPPKFPKLVTLSKEAYDDARPVRVRAVEAKVLQAIGLGFDAAGFHGGASSLHPGLAHTTGISTVAVDVDDTAYDWAADAVGDLLDANGNPGLLYISPFTVRSLLKLKDTTGEYRIVDLQAAAASLMGVPVRITKGVADGEAFAVDPSVLLVIRRQDVQTEVFPGYDVDHAIVGVRTMMRAQLVVTDPGGVVHITGLPVPE